MIPSFDFGPFLGVMPDEKKKPIRFPDAKFYAESFEEKIFETIQSLFQKLARPRKSMVCFGPI